jgi:oligopeptide/dipeptide ABC transporter ATP-binding protein
MSFLHVQNLRKWFPVQTGFFGKAKEHVHALDDVTFGLDEGETIGLVGESGCGKTTLGRLILRLMEPTSGSVLFFDEDVTRMSKTRLHAWRRNGQMIFQDPFASLNPRMRIRDIVAEGMIIHRLAPRSEVPDRVLELLETVGLGGDSMNRFPHEFSGGQRQRIGIARALAVEPKFIIADEPVSALDVSIQAQIVNLLMDLQESKKIAYLFISHDLRVVEFISSRVIVMYLGRVMETLPSKGLAESAQHPYTKALLSAIPVPDPLRKKTRIVLGGDVPNPIHPPSGCVFHPRCALAQARCRSEIPILRKIAASHTVACHLV